MEGQFKINSLSKSVLVEPMLPGDVKKPARFPSLSHSEDNVFQANQLKGAKKKQVSVN
jgi:hypothetical protein